jgi:purine-binding chemotaxis protein CheW
MSNTRQLCTFLLDGQLFGISVDCVLEVIRSLPLTQVPLAPEAVCGLINLRGQIVTAIDLRRRLNLHPAQEGRPARMNIIIRTPEGPLCFPIDEVGDVMDVEESLFEPVPDTMTGVARKLIDCVCKLPDHLLLVLRGDFNELAGV